MKKAKLYFFLLLLASACRDPESLPIIPEISFKSMNQLKNAAGKDSLIYLEFNYTDGDGDLGLAQSDTFPPFNYAGGNNLYYNNIFIDYLEKKNNVFVPVRFPFDTTRVRFLYRIDVLTPEGKNKAIKGVITTYVDVSPYSNAADTVKFMMQIVDRKLHLSNVIESPELILVK